MLLALLFGARSLSAPSVAAGDDCDHPGSGTPPTPLPPVGGGSVGAGLRPEATAAVAPDAEVSP